LAASVKEIGATVTGVQGDVSNLADLDRLFAQIKREKGKLDIVFANAGGAQFAPLGKVTEDHFDALFNGNVKGLPFTVQKALPLLPDGASIILNAAMLQSRSAHVQRYRNAPAAGALCTPLGTIDLKRRWTHSG